MSQQSTSPTFNVDVASAMSSNTVLHTNVGQNIIITTEDKITLILAKARDWQKTVTQCWTAFGLLISIITTLSTATFKDVLGLNASDWKAIFAVGLIATIIWLVISVFRLLANWKKGSPEKIIAEIKQTSS